METFTGWEYLLIDACNTFGNGKNGCEGDKLLFRERIEWTLAHLEELEELVSRADSKPLFLKAVQAIRRAQAGQPSGHLVAFDATCSGLQIMSALTGCISGANATGLIDPNRRADAYTEATELTGKYLGTEVVLQRKDIKTGVMTHFYGSRKEPQNLFGKDTPELKAFYDGLEEMAPGACMLLEVLRDTWNPDALVHEWDLPDGFHARVKVMAEKEATIEVDELDHLTFTYLYEENEPLPRGVANIANVVHSIDAYLLRSLLRRCNYDPETVHRALRHIEAELLARHMDLNQKVELDGFWLPEWRHYMDCWEATRMADVVILPYVDAITVTGMDTEHLKALSRIANQMLAYQPFPVVTVHDSFASHPNNMNWVRHWYKEILAELSESNALNAILSQLYGFEGTIEKLSEGIGEKIRQSNYALC